MSGVTLSQATPSDILQQWRDAMAARFGEEAEEDPIVRALLNLLSALEWSGSARRIVEALPDHPLPLSMEDLRNTLARLGMRSVPHKLAARKLAEALCPCLLVPSNGAAPIAVVARTEDGFEITADNDVGARRLVSKLPRGTFYFIDPVEEPNTEGPEGAKRWIRGLLTDFRSVILWAFVAAFFINVLSLAGPLSIMVIYDQVIAKESLGTLDWLLLGVVGAAVFEIILRVLRARIQAYIGAKLDYQIGSRVFQHVMHLPPLFTERAPVGGQVTRIREFDGFRELFAGPLASVLLDLPFTLLFVLVLFLIGGPLAAVPVVLAVTYLLLAWLVLPVLRERTRATGVVRSSRYAFLVELVWGMRAIKQQDGGDIWKRRFRKLSADASWSNFRVSEWQNGSLAVAQSIMFLSGVATLTFGVMLVSEGSMSLGALIATMMLVWRILGPIQTLFSIASRVEQIYQSVSQLISVLGYRPEQTPGTGPSIPIKFRGELKFNRVSMRYSQDGNPAMLGVSFTAQPGEMIGVAGESGAGKSTLAKLAMGLYRPQGGSVTLDGVDLRQMKPITLRQTLGYVPQRNHAFPGSLLDNIRLADPGASLDRVRYACRMAGILHKIEALPEGFDTVFRDGLQNSVPQGFLRQLALARAFLCDSPLLVLDEPTSSMDSDDENYFLRALEVLRGEKTIIMITQRPSHMLLCDRLAYMEQGELRYMDTPERVLDVLKSRAAPTVVGPSGANAVGQGASGGGGGSALGRIGQ